jgi:hypothetical protein
MQLTLEISDDRHQNDRPFVQRRQVGKHRDEVSADSVARCSLEKKPGRKMNRAPLEIGSVFSNFCVL